MSDFLRIGIVCYPSIGGSGILATHLGKLLADAGHELHFISYERPVKLDLPSPNLHFHEVTVSEYALFRYPDYTLPLSVKIAELSEAYDLDVLHVHYAVPHATAALLARQMRPGHKRPVIVTTLHGTDTTLMGRDPHYRPIIKYSMESSDGVTTVSHALKAQTLENFGLEHPIEVIHNFYDPKPPQVSREQMRRELGVADDEVLLLHMSNLRPVKRFPDILEALSLMQTQPKVKLLVMAGTDFSPFRAQAEKLGVADRIIVREAVWEVSDYIEASDIGLYASEQESFGLSILESLSYGRPVVATRTGGIPEVVREGETGLLVPVGDTAAMARAVDRLVQNPELRQLMGTMARDDAFVRFSGPPVRDRYLELYRRLLREAGA
ncbi:MAG: N-acetyl-alpha-D-glucosaminyl L-malate synthase BshA [Verrucomicrobiota bacterium JB022]|nr:N-acetyl-alpha-D-glucosaminyl L-malate synthase BshA [Verrucomicrobiota bacterium JB022]